MPLSVSVASAWVYYGHTSGISTATSGSFSGVTGDMFVAVCYSDSSFSSFSASNSNTWTQAVSDGFGGYTFYRVLTGSETTTVSLTSAAANGLGVMVFKVTGQTSTPIGATGSLRLNSTQNYTPTVFTSTAAGSILIFGANDINDKGSPTSSDLTYTSFDTAGNGGFNAGISGYKTLGAAGPQTVNVQAPVAGPNWCWTAIEILSADVTAAATPASAAPAALTVTGSLGVPLGGSPVSATVHPSAPTVTGTPATPQPLNGAPVPAGVTAGPPAVTGTLAAPMPLAGTPVPASARPAAPTPQGLFLPPTIVPHQVPTYQPGVAAPATDLRWWIGTRPFAYGTGTSQPVASSGWVTVPVPTTVFDRDGGFGNVSYTGGYSIGKTLGAYRVSGNVTFPGNVSGLWRKIRLAYNGTPIPGTIIEQPAPGVAVPITLTIPPVVVPAVSTADVVTVQAYQDTGSTVTLVSATLQVDWTATADALQVPIGILVADTTTTGGAVPQPGIPVFGPSTTTSYQPADGLALSSITLAWVQPLNADGSTDTDGDHYEIQWMQTGSSTGWQSQIVSWSELQATINGLSLGTSYDFQIRAVNGNGTDTNYGTWSATTTLVSGKDVTPPAQPAPPTVAGSLIAVQVTHNLSLATGGSFNLPPDMDHLEVHIGASSGFTPTTLTLAGKLAANAGMLAAGIPAVGTFPISSTATVWVAVIAVDKSGNRSTPSGAASVTSTLIDDSHISNLTVTKVTGGTISATWLIGGTIATATSGARVSIDSAGVHAYDSGGNNTLTINATGAVTATGNFAFTTATSGNVVSISSANADRINFTTPGGTSYVNASGNVNPTISMVATSGAYVAAGYYTATLYSTSSNRIDTTNTGSTVTGNLQVNGTLSATTWSISTLTLSSTLTVNGNTNLYGTTLTLNPSGNINGTASGIYLTGSSGPVNLSGSSQVNLASGSSSVNVSGGTIVASSTVFQPTSLVSASTTSSFSANVYTSSSTNGQLYRVTSSSRYKRDIRPAVVDPREVLAIEAVTFVDRTAWEANGESAAGIHRGLGVIAEQVADAAPRLADWLVPRDEDGQPDSFAYDRMVIALLEVVKQQDARLAALEHH